LSEDFLPCVEKFELQPLVLPGNNHQRSFLSNCLDNLSQNSRNNSYNWTTVKREDSPDFIELEAQIEALRFVAPKNCLNADDKKYGL
jgi:hypothetical protein